MRLLVNLIVILTLTAVTVAQERPRSASETQQSDTESLIQLEKDLFRAKMTSDPEVIGKVLADDWVNITPTGRGWGKPELIERLHQHPGELPPYSAQQQDLQVFLFGNTAVAAYFEEDTAKPDQHLPWGNKLQTDVTDVFVKDGGTWKLRMSRASPHFQQ